MVKINQKRHITRKGVIKRNPKPKNDYKPSRWGYRRRIGKHECGGTMWEYEATGFLPETTKCDRCGSELEE
jgi:hypothetical protein